MCTDLPEAEIVLEYFADNRDDYKWIELEYFCGSKCKTLILSSFYNEVQDTFSSFMLCFLMSSVMHHSRTVLKVCLAVPQYGGLNPLFMYDKS
jgi:hypothetical protein